MTAGGSAGLQLWAAAAHRTCDVHIVRAVAHGGGHHRGADERKRSGRAQQHLGLRGDGVEAGVVADAAGQNRDLLQLGAVLLRQLQTQLLQLLLAADQGGYRGRQVGGAGGGMKQWRTWRWRRAAAAPPPSASQSPSHALEITAQVLGNEPAREARGACSSTRTISSMWRLRPCPPPAACRHSPHTTTSKGLAMLKMSGINWETSGHLGMHACDASRCGASWQRSMQAARSFHRRLQAAAL